MQKSLCVTTAGYSQQKGGVMTRTRRLSDESARKGVLEKKLSAVEERLARVSTKLRCCMQQQQRVTLLRQVGSLSERRLGLKRALR